MPSDVGNKATSEGIILARYWRVEVVKIAGKGAAAAQPCSMVWSAAVLAAYRWGLSGSVNRSLILPYRLSPLGCNIFPVYILVLF